MSGYRYKYQLSLSLSLCSYSREFNKFILAIYPASASKTKNKYLLPVSYPFFRFQALALSAGCGSDWGEVTKESRVKNNCDNYDVRII